MNLLRSTILASSVVAISSASACYVSSAYNDCYYYYGYYYPYCDYGYYGAYSTSDAYSTQSYSEVQIEEAPNPNPDFGSTAPDQIVNITSYSYLAHNGSDEDPPNLDAFDDRYPCNEASEGLLTLCTSDDQPFDTEAEYLVIGVQLETPLPQADDVNFLVVTFAFDTDNDASNNYIPPVEQPNEYTGGTDKWIVASQTPDDGWTLEAYEWDGTEIVEIETNARVIFEADSAALVVPNSEFVESIPGNRFSLFRHTGDQGANGDWSGLVYPPLGGPLAGP